MALGGSVAQVCEPRFLNRFTIQVSACFCRLQGGSYAESTSFGMKKSTCSVAVGIQFEGLGCAVVHVTASVVRVLSRKRAAESCKATPRQDAYVSSSENLILLEGHFRKGPSNALEG